jgi:hypothetical protein
MTNRPTRLLRAVLSGLVACASIAIIPLSAEGAPGDCLLTRPKTAAPPGQYWLHLSDWINNRHCWVLRAKIETPSQAKGSASVQAARAGARTSGATPARSPEDTGSNELPARTDLFAQPRIKDDGKGASAADATARMSERADQNISRAEQPDRARLPPVASREVEATGIRFPASGSQATPAFATQAQMTDRSASIEAGPAPLSTVAETTTETRAIGAPSLLQMLLLAIFCGPALYLLAAGAIRRLAEPKPRPQPYASLENASAERALLPPRLESNENAVAS